MFPYHALICSSHIESDTANLNSWNKVFFKFNDSRSKKVLCNNMSLIDINFDVEDSLLMKHGPNTIRFDAMGALFVVGGSNGKLLVYDFDESLALTTLNKYGSFVFICYHILTICNIIENVIKLRNGVSNQLFHMMSEKKFQIFVGVSLIMISSMFLILLISQSMLLI